MTGKVIVYSRIEMEQRSGREQSGGRLAVRIEKYRSENRVGKVIRNATLARI